MKMTIDEAIEILKQIRDGWNMSLCHGYEHVGAMHMAIEALKKQKTGKWVLVEMGDTNLYECSLCRNRKRYTPPFCDICGAKMEEGE